ncbi:hypothetical protein KC722_01385 [Candidatus Kaiserbacteria bacterium]|nr:hypothetical protein [Candidatus Kaiserbacteria bacterium]MCB9811293.1 hypothetical protein [Candidatus Nomurabacteria bacterium]
MKFYLPAEAPPVTDSALLAQARSGPDQTLAEATSVTPRANDGLYVAAKLDTRTRLQTQTKKGPQLFGRNPVDLIDRQKKQRDERVRKLKIVALSAALLLCVVVVVWRLFFSTFTVEAQVESFSWQRSVSIERYQTVRESDWSIPSGGTKVAEDWRIRRYEEVFDRYVTVTRQVSEQVQTGSETYSCGSRDLGNGFFEDQTCTRPTYTTQDRTEYEQQPVYREEPVYDWYYTYDIDKWLHDRVERAGDTNQRPKWPEYTLDGDIERVAKQDEKYLVRFKTVEDEIIEREYPLESWAKLRIGQQFQIDRNRVGHIQAIKPLT